MKSHCKYIKFIVQKINDIWDLLKYKSQIVILYENKSKINNHTEARICQVTEDNINDSSVYDGKLTMKKYRKMLLIGDIGYYAYLNNEWVHRSWVKVGPNKVDKWHHIPPFKLRSNEACCHLGETVPSARGYGISPAVLSKIISDLRGKFDHIYTIVDENNFPSRRAVEKAGFKAIKRKKVFSIMGLNFWIPIK